MEAFYKSRNNGEQHAKTNIWLCFQVMLIIQRKLKLMVLMLILQMIENNIIKIIAEAEATTVSSVKARAVSKMKNGNACNIL